MEEENVQILLDLREYDDKLQTADDFISLWSEVSPAFGEGIAVNEGERKLIRNKKGTIGIKFIAIPKQLSLITKDANFAVHSVLQKQELFYKCNECQQTDHQQKYGPFKCSVCENRICDEHAIIIDGKMQAFCREHHPVCKASGLPATFWCDGPLCHGRIAWSDQYRKNHPNHKYYWYCPECYEALFPKCNSSACENTGINHCEYVLTNVGTQCTKQMCDRHVRRWQVYGPHKRGLSLCPEHQGVNTWSAQKIIGQIAWATAKRNLAKKRANRPKQWLPTLNSFKHAIIKNIGIKKDLPEILAELQAFARNVQQDRFGSQLKSDVENCAERWNNEIKNNQDYHEIGQKVFENLKTCLFGKGLYDVAAEVKYSDYKFRAKILYIRLDNDRLKGLFIGKGGSNIKDLQSRLNITINFERARI